MAARIRAVASVVFALLLVAGCTATSAPAGTHRVASASPSTSTAAPSVGPSGGATTVPPSRLTLHPAKSRLTRQGFWWGVDSTTSISGASLSNVHDFYRGGHDPVVWGRYLNGPFAVHRSELSFAAHHHIAMYFLVPDLNCSRCAGGGDLCGNDRTAAQARDNARSAIRAARRLRLPPGVDLFKDLEQVGSCEGELSGRYVLAWFHVVGHSRYRPAFYGNSTAQRWDFPRAFCAAVTADHDLARDVVLAQDEPEPDIGAPPGAIGPRNAPPFRPKHPHCTRRSDISIWQYGESVSADNVTDVDEIRPGTPGLLLPGGSASGGAQQ